MRRRPFLVLAMALAAAASPAFAAHGGGEKKKGGGESYIQLPAMTASIAKSGGARGVLTVETGLDIPDEALRERATQLTPRLRDAYFRFLMTYAATAAIGAPPNPDTIGAAMQKATDEVLGKPGAKFLLGTVMVN